MVRAPSRRSATPRRGASFVFSVPHFGQGQVRMVGDDSFAEWLWKPIVQIHELNDNPPFESLTLGDHWVMTYISPEVSSWHSEAKGTVTRVG